MRKKIRCDRCGKEIGELDEDAEPQGEMYSPCGIYCGKCKWK